MPQNDETFTRRPYLALGAFLRSRRERLTPVDVGIRDVGRRRTTGLRREEVAQLAGISAAWYTLLEQGRDVHPSREVLDALARALRLDVCERVYVFQLAFGPRRGTDRRALTGASPMEPGELSPSVRRLLDAFGPAPALIINRCWDLAGVNAALAAVLPDLSPERASPDTPPVNVVEYVLTSDALRAGLRDWAQVARLAVDGLRASVAGAAPDEPLAARAAALVAQLTARSAEFRAWWPAQGLWAADRPVTHVYAHPQVGPLEVDGTMLDVRSAPGLTLVTYVPCDPESAAQLRHLMGAPR
jgi:transcriptional regulator with XRE-family HTH domain